jgi:hypothetical protein
VTGQLQDLSPRELYDALVRILDRTHPFLRSLRIAHWEMSLDWWLAIRRAAVSHLDEDDPARDESKWVPDPEDIVLGYRITVTDGGGAPHLVSDEAAPAYERSPKPEEMHA